MLELLNKNIRRLCSKLRRTVPRRSSRPRIVIQKLGKSNSKSHNDNKDHKKPHLNGSAAIYPNGYVSSSSKPQKPIRIATFNAALFSMAPAVPNAANFRTKSTTDPHPRSILKQSPLHHSGSLTKQQKFPKSRLRVSINLPHNEISLGRSRRLDERDGDFPSKLENGFDGERFMCRTNVTALDVLRELDADILALQDVKAEEEKAMKPLSDLAAALEMHYVFAESWAPQYGNAVLSKWPIKRWKVQKICDDTDFRNVLKATVEVPEVGEVNLYCTHLDHLDEDWRMKQIEAIVQANYEPHLLAGGLNSLDDSDYSQERWTDIVRYYEDMGKPSPKVEVMRFLKRKQYTDAKDFAGECESVVMITKGQRVQGTCKYGTRVDYIMASPSLPYKFVPGSYSVLSSKGTSDHHIVKVDIAKVESIHEIVTKEWQQQQQTPPATRRVMKIIDFSSKATWRTEMR
ncbi:hypothetical protein Nepgr_029634 [Nepenthes gracilis]|uniref:Endonuclease/exonuclease/phosphatase domain-containing protein n=1 Tax=Nepenthes gracilis TaxID=150966 RepID=A0AAD3TEN3_NEPGR|nr:hypothetical protein Nepgr_029634 [Nepenthes gracilis]